MKLHNKIDKKVLRSQLVQSREQRTTLSFYQYAHIDSPEAFRDELYQKWLSFHVFGRIYIAKEGINAQLSLPTAEFSAFREHLDSIAFLKGVRLNIAIEDTGRSFYKLIIKVREKIVADGLNDATFDVTNRGIHLDAKSFNQLAENPDTVIVDMRNHYESEVGHFKNAITPEVETFRQSLPIVAEMLEAHRDKNIVMYCTGGIRCEKASAYLKHRGFGRVFQLNGGIIEYARQVRAKGLENKFIGKNFVFDERLGERISEEVIAQCHQCGKPCDVHVNCANDACHLLFIQCEECKTEMKGCCSAECSDFMQLPEAIRVEQWGKKVFNGTFFSKNHKNINKLRRK